MAGQGRNRTAAWPSRRLPRGLGSDTRGSVSLMMALSSPVLVLMAGISIEVSSWAMAQAELQRTADLAALAGGVELNLASDARNAAFAAADLARLNGAEGSGSRAWNAADKLLADGRITAQVTAGLRDSKSTAVKVTVNRTMPFVLTQSISSLSSVTITATGWAELSAGQQPCILALATTGDAIKAQGNPDVVLNGCTARSNASIQTGGSARLSAQSLYAGGTISGPGISGTLYPDAGTIPDPYATHAPLQNALKSLSPGAGSPFSDKPKSDTILSPGTYSSWDIKGTVSLQPGIYYVNGDIQLGAQASVSGTGVTIVASGTLQLQGGANLAVSAAKAGSATGGAIAGIVFAGASTGTSSFYGNTQPSLTGVIYYPSGNLQFGGGAQGGTTGCLEVVAKTVELRGNSSLASNCASYGAKTFSSSAKATSVLLSQ